MSDLGTILLVEDNPDDVFALKRELRKTGIKNAVQVVTDGKQALAYLSGESPFSDRGAHPLPYLLLLDLKLPFYSGHEILKWIRENQAFANLSVVILSGSDESRDREKAQAHGANGYLVKPVTGDVLLTALQCDI